MRPAASLGLHRSCMEKSWNMHKKPIMGHRRKRSRPNQRQHQSAKECVNSKTHCPNCDCEYCHKEAATKGQHRKRKIREVLLGLEGPRFSLLWLFDFSMAKAGCVLVSEIFSAHTCFAVFYWLTALLGLVLFSSQFVASEVLVVARYLADSFFFADCRGLWNSESPTVCTGVHRRMPTALGHREGVGQCRRRDGDAS